MTVENVEVPESAIEARKAAAMESQAADIKRQADALTAQAAAFAQIAGVSGNPKMDRFERVLIACVQGGVSRNVEGYLTFARELCDGIDREFPET